MELKVEGSQLEELIHAAVLRSLDDTAKVALVTEVVRHLTTQPPSNGYGHRPSSPLFNALHNAADRACRAYFEKKLETDPAFVKELEGLFTAAVAKFCDAENREKLVGNMASRLSAAFGDR